MDALFDLKTRKTYFIVVNFTYIGEPREYINVKLLDTSETDSLLRHPCIIKLDGYQHHYDTPRLPESTFYGVVLDKLLWPSKTGERLRVIPASNLELMSAVHGEISDRILAFKQYEKEAQLP